jgi:hypothetical protein
MQVLLADGALGVVLALLWIYCILEAITSDAERVRNLPKLTWVIIVIVLSDIGSIAWLVAGRPTGPPRGLPYKGNTGVPPEYDRPGRAAASSPDDDAAFLAQLKARADEQRRKARREQRDDPPGQA